MKRAWYLGTMLTALGVILLAAALAYSYSGLRSMHAEIANKEVQRDSLDAAIDTLQKQVDLLVHGPLWDLATVDANAVRLEGRKDGRGRQLYDFGLWLNVPNNRKQDIAEVGYRRRFGESLQAVLVGTEPSNGFGVSYLGWGCFPVLDVTIVERSGTMTTKRVDQCHILDSGGVVWGE